MAFHSIQCHAENTIDSEYITGNMCIFINDFLFIFICVCQSMQHVHFDGKAKSRRRMKQSVIN